MNFKLTIIYRLYINKSREKTIMKPLAIAHRGYHKTYFENTYEAFVEASKRDYFGIETDIHLTKDNVWITHHNNEIKSNGKLYPISEYTFEELKDLPLDNNQNHIDAHICLFKDYLKICKENHKKPVIEIKNSPKTKYLFEMAGYVDEYIGIENVIFIAFYPWPIWRLKKRYKKRIFVQQLVEDHKELIWISLFKKIDVDLDCKLVNDKIIKKFHKRNLGVNAWTVDSIDELRRLEKLGIDYITSNVFDENS